MGPRGLLTYRGGFRSYFLPERIPFPFADAVFSIAGMGIPYVSGCILTATRPCMAHSPIGRPVFLPDLTTLPLALPDFSAKLSE